MNLGFGSCPVRLAGPSYSTAPGIPCSRGSAGSSAGDCNSDGGRSVASLARAETRDGESRMMTLLRREWVQRWFGEHFIYMTDGLTIFLTKYLPYLSRVDSRAVKQDTDRNADSRTEHTSA